MHIRPTYASYEQLERRAAEARAEADVACLRALGAAQHLVGLLDRYHGDAGDDASALDDVTACIEAVSAAVVTMLGEPRERSNDIGLVPVRLAP